VVDGLLNSLLVPRRKGLLPMPVAFPLQKG